MLLLNLKPQECSLQVGVHVCLNVCVRFPKVKNKVAVSCSSTGLGMNQHQVWNISVAQHGPLPSELKDWLIDSRRRLSSSASILGRGRRDTHFANIYSQILAFSRRLVTGGRMGFSSRFSRSGVPLGANSSASEGQNLLYPLCLPWQEKGKKAKISQ